MIVAAEDGTCAPKYAEAIRAEIGEAVHLYKEIPGVGHGYFSDCHTPEFLKLMEETLQYYKQPARNLAHMDEFSYDAGFSVITSVTLTTLLAITIF